MSSTDSLGNIAVLDVGVTTQKIVLLDSSNPQIPLTYHKLYYPLASKKLEFSSFLKSLFRSYAEYMIRTFIITITAEPLFGSAAESVAFLIDTVTRYIRPEIVLCYTKQGEYISITEAKKRPVDVVSAGWTALAKYVAETIDPDILVVEWSTRTFSITPVKNRKIDVPLMNNLQRIKNDLLLFYGVLETNIAHIAPILEYKGEKYNLPFKNHAITGDVFLLTNDITEPTYICDPPDYGETTPDGAIKRIRTALCDAEEELTKDQITEIAHLLKDLILKRITAVVEAKLEAHGLNKVLLTGIGTNMLFEHLKNNNKIDKLLRASDIIDTAELTPSFSIGYLYSKKPHDD